MDIEEAQKKVNWCVEKEGPKGVKGIVDSEDFDHIEFNVSFWHGTPHTKGSHVKGVKIPRRWLEDCHPDRNIISPQMRGLMTELARLKQELEEQL